MSGFVRAVAIAERSLLGSEPRPHDPGVVVVDEARREGLRVILLTDRTFGELRRGGDALLRHFDGVVAEVGTGGGAALRVGAGPVRRVPATAREALLEVLEELDVDPHDTLGVCGDPAEADVLGALEVTVLAGRGRAGADYGVPGSGAAALRRVLDDTRAGRPAVSPARHDVKVTARGARRRGVHVPGAHANVLVCTADSHPDGNDVPVQLIDSWSRAGYSTVVVDLVGRHTSGAVIDPRAARWREDFRDVLRCGAVSVVLSMAGVPDRTRSGLLVAALADIGARRRSNGRPHWLVIDPIEPVFADPDLPPESLDLGLGGHCLVVRDHDARPPVLGSGVNVVLGCSPSCPVSAGRTARADR